MLFRSRLREELGVNSTCGASNVSFGMPDRERINAAFLPMAIACGLTSAITNPLAAEVKAAIMAADVLMGNDQDAGRWIRAHRAAAVPAASTVVPAPGTPTDPGQPAGLPPSSRPRINRRTMARAAGPNGSQA